MVGKRDTSQLAYNLEKFAQELKHAAEIAKTRRVVASIHTVLVGASLGYAEDYGSNPRLERELRSIAALISNGQYQEAADATLVLFSALRFHLDLL